MRFYVFLQILGPLEGLLTKITLVWLQRNMDTDMGRDMIAFNCSSSTSAPLACEAEIVG